MLLYRPRSGPCRFGTRPFNFMMGSIPMNQSLCLTIIGGLVLLIGCSRQTGEYEGLNIDMRRQTYSSAIEQGEDITPILYRKMSDQRPLILESLLVIGSSKTTLTLYSLYRHGGDPYGMWWVSEISVMTTGGTDFWIIGKKQMQAPVSKHDLEEFMEDTWWHKGKDDFNIESEWVNAKWYAQKDDPAGRASRGY